MASVDGVGCKIAEAESYWTSDRNAAVKIRFSGKEGELSNSPAMSVMKFFEDTVAKYPNHPAMKVERDNTWVTWTYSEYLRDVKTAAKGFIKLGLEPCNSVGILGFNSPEWLFADLGAIYAGGFACGIYTTNNEETCQYVASDASCNILVVENDLQLQKILSVWEKLPALKCIIQYTGELKEKKPNLYTWKEFMDIGKAEDENALSERLSNQAPNKCCTLIYTSGTTGNPKGVMLSHDNILMEVKGISNSLDPWISDAAKSQDVCISYLPLSHIAAQMTDIFIPILAGAVVYFARPDALKGSLGATLQAARPTLFVGVPRVYEKIEEKMKSIGASVTGLKKKIGTWAKGVAYRGNQNKLEGKSMPCGWTLAHLLVLNKVRKALGLDRAKLLFTAAAPISKQTLDYFSSLDIPLLELYGMSESGGALTISTPDLQRPTSIGQLFCINEHMFADQDEDGNGELCFRGRNVFMGYLANEAKTKETIDDDGWLHTGDVGRVDKDDFYYITGRIKELIITAGGENVAPVPIEENVKAELPLVAQAMVIGDKQRFLSILLTLQVVIDLETGLPTDELTPVAVAYLKSIGVEAKAASEIAKGEVPDALSKAIQKGIDTANKKAVNNASRVQKWKLLPLDFTTSGGELGPTQKLRRPQVLKMYKETIDAFYA